MNKKILVVDDEKDICLLLFKILEKKGYKVLTSGDGNEAIRIVKKENLDLIFLDLEMPGINGVETLRGVRKFNKDVPVIIISASENERLVNEALKLRIFARSSKPFNLEELVIMVKRAMKCRGNY